MEKRFVVDVTEDEYGNAVIVLPDEVITHLNAKEGDNLDWEDNGDGSFTIKKVAKPKVETEWVLVECVSSFRKRYMVEVPKGQTEWALDTVADEAAVEFSQEYLGEQIVSYRVVSFDDAIVMCDQDNEYGSGWDLAMKKQAYFTPWTEENQDD